MSVSRWRRDFRKFRLGLPRDVRGNSDLAFAAFLTQRRKRLIASPLFASARTGRARAKRLAARSKSKIVRGYFYGGPKRQIITAPELLLYRVRPDALRDTISPQFLSTWRNISDRLRKKKHGHLRLVDLSFIRNPKGTLSQIREVIEAAGKCLYIQLDFADRYCDDIAPYIVLAHVMKALPRVFVGGSITGEMIGVLQAVGLDRPLGINRIMIFRERSPLVLPFKMHSRMPPGFFGDLDHQLRPQHKELVADRFCTALEQWLSINNLELTATATESLSNSITEALDNAERHGRPDVDGGMGDWSIAGFSRLLRDDDGDVRLHCSFAIISIGATIDESLRTAAPSVQTRIDSYVRHHSRRGSDAARRLRTVMAVQDGITRVSAASEESRGGIGLMGLVNMIAVVGATDIPALQSVFTILSGDACVRITHPYNFGVHPADSTLRELWFNPENRVTRAPDPNHVFSVPDRFGGTVLSANFTIDPEFIHGTIANEPTDNADH